MKKRQLASDLFLVRMVFEEGFWKEVVDGMGFGLVMSVYMFIYELVSMLWSGVLKAFGCVGHVYVSNNNS